jgi:hypothetical protein
MTVRSALLAASLVAAVPLLSGCLALGVAGAAVGVAGVTAKAVGATAKGAGKVVGAVIPDRDKTDQTDERQP